MSFGSFAFGAGYFGGSPRRQAASITGSGACTLAPATCSGSGVVPSHGVPVVPSIGGGGFAPLPFRKPPKRIRGDGRIVMRSPMARGTAARARTRSVVASLYIRPVICSGIARNVSAGARDEGLLLLALALPD